MVLEQSTARGLDLATRVHLLRSGRRVLAEDAAALAGNAAMEAAHFSYGGTAA